MKEHHVFHKEVNHAVRNVRHLVGSNLYIARRHHQLTLQKLAQRSHLTSDVIDRIELGKGELNLIHIARLAKTLDVDLLTLFMHQP